MTSLIEFVSSLQNDGPTQAVSEELKALWYDGVGDWDRSHDIAQDIPGREGARIHAYLHRKEGDLWNANYWYRQAGIPMPDISLDEEWKHLVVRYLERKYSE